MPRALVLCLATTLLAGSLPAVVLAQEAKPPGTAEPAPSGTAAPAPAATPAPAAGAAPASTSATADSDADKKRVEAANDRKAMFEARLAGLHAGLLLTSEQEKMWPAVETAIRGFVKMRTEQGDKHADRRQDADEEDDWDGDDPIAALTEYSDGLLERGRVLKAVADSAGPLWATMTEEQKHRLPKLLRDMIPRHPPHGRRAADRDEDDRDGRRRPGPSFDEPRDRDARGGRDRRDPMADNDDDRDDGNWRRAPRERRDDRDPDERW